MKNFFITDEFKKIVETLLNKLYKKQLEGLVFMDNNDKGTITFPTGSGKSLMIYADILRKLPDYNNFVIASHRLMLNSQHATNIINEFKDVLGEFGIIVVGSDPYEAKLNKKDKKDILKTLNSRKLNYRDIITTSTSIKEINEAVEKHKNNNRKVIIISTYHSLDRLCGVDIDVIYCDEAHLLASQELESQFKENFNKIKFKKSYFFTATPKDSFDEDTDAFLMNNIDIFGERYGLEFKEAVELGLICKPVIHLAIPTNYDSTKKFGSIQNYCRFVKETYMAHLKMIKDSAVDKNLIEPKLLIKCPSVDEMWYIINILSKDPDLANIHIFAGASRTTDSDTGECHKYSFNGNITEIASRQYFLKKIQKLKDTDLGIVLHYDIFSEGIDVPGLTGTKFLGDSLPTKPKILQNIGRSTRLNENDRKRLRENSINANDYLKWIKPYCAVILPIIDIESEYVVQQISETIKSLRDRFGFDPTYYVSEGTDIAKVVKDEDLEKLNNKNRKPKTAGLIERIKQEIEKLDNNDELIKFRQKADEVVGDDLKLKALFEKEFMN